MQLLVLWISDFMSFVEKDRDFDRARDLFKNWYVPAELNTLLMLRHGICTMIVNSHWRMPNRSMGSLLPRAPDKRRRRSLLEKQ